VNTPEIGSIPKKKKPWKRIVWIVAICLALLFTIGFFLYLANQGIFEIFWKVCWKKVYVIVTGAFIGGVVVWFEFFEKILDADRMKKSKWFKRNSKKQERF